jgi:hypothetical protein
MGMFSHVVIFWAKPEPDAANKIKAGAERYLKSIPGIESFHVGKMASSVRPVVDQSYQVALNIIFESQKAQDDYQVHPQHLEFVEKIVKPFCASVKVYDFE